MSLPTNIPQLGFDPPAGYAFDLEVMPANTWLERIPAEQFKHPSRIDFHQLVLVSRGHFEHMVDFQLESAPAGTLLVMRPGQVQRFETNRDWEGWFVIFKSEAYAAQDAPNLGDIPVHLSLTQESFDAVQEAIVRLHRDASLAIHSPLASAMVRAQLQALVLRLQMLSALQPDKRVMDSTLTRHFSKFRHAIEQNFQGRQRVSSYAHSLGLSEKTLSRATQAVVGLSAKAYLSKRLALEAKRLLAYTPGPIAIVADQLGFDEATNFVKFFRREVGDTPSGFRKSHRG
jgi:AraC-like DNA-binding protein